MAITRASQEINSKINLYLILDEDGCSIYYDDQKFTAKNDETMDISISNFINMLIDSQTPDTKINISIQAQGLNKLGAFYLALINELGTYKEKALKINALTIGPIYKSIYNNYNNIKIDFNNMTGFYPQVPKYLTDLNNDFQDIISICLDSSANILTIPGAIVDQANLKPFYNDTNVPNKTNKYVTELKILTHLLDYNFYELHINKIFPFLNLFSNLKSLTLDVTIPNKPTDNLSDKNITMFHDYLENHPTLTEINLEFLRVERYSKENSTITLKNIISFLNNNSLVTKVTSNVLNFDETPALSSLDSLCHALKENKTLTYLNLEIGEKGEYKYINSLCTALKENKTLTYLELKMVSSKEFQYSFPLLFQNHCSLKILDLNVIYMTQYVYLLFYLHHNNTLTALNIRKNYGFHTETMSDLFLKTLSFNKTLQVFLFPWSKNLHEKIKETSLLYIDDEKEISKKTNLSNLLKQNQHKKRKQDTFNLIYGQISVFHAFISANKNHAFRESVLPLLREITSYAIDDDIPPFNNYIKHTPNPIQLNELAIKRPFTEYNFFKRCMESKSSNEQSTFLSEQNNFLLGKRKR